MQNRRINVFLFFILYFTQAYSYAIELVSVSTGGEQGDGHSLHPALSGDARFVAFGSISTNLVSGLIINPGYGLEHIYVHDRQTGITEPVDIGKDGSEAFGESYGLDISADGRYVAYTSSADNLLDADSDFVSDIFVYDRQTKTTELISVSSNNVKGNDFSEFTSISGDGRFVVFSSNADNLIPSDNNDYYDVFIRDRLLGTTEIVSNSSSGVQGNADSSHGVISSDGNFIVFQSIASNLVNGDTNLKSDIFVLNRTTGLLRRISIPNSSAEANGDSRDPSVSLNGRFISYTSEATNLVGHDLNGKSDVFIYDTNTGLTQLVSLSSDGTQGNNNSSSASISNDGQFVLFGSHAGNLVDRDFNNSIDVFLHDRSNGATQIMTVSDDGVRTQSVGLSGSTISADGQFVAFASYSDRLSTEDANGKADVLVKQNAIDQLEGLSVLVNPSSTSVLVNEKAVFSAKITNVTNQVLTQCTVKIVNSKENGKNKFGFYSWSPDLPGIGANPVFNLTAGQTIRIRLVVKARVAVHDEVKFTYSCNQASALTIPFENSVQLVAKSQSLISEDFTQLKNGNGKTLLTIDRNSGKFWSTYVVNVKNTGSNSSTLSLISTTSIADSKLRQPRLCETIGNGDWKCINSPVEQLLLELESGQSKNILVFVRAKQSIDHKPAAHRLFIEALDQSGNVVAKNGIAVRTIN